MVFRQVKVIVKINLGFYRIRICRNTNLNLWSEQKIFVTQNHNTVRLNDQVLYYSCRLFQFVFKL